MRMNAKIIPNLSLYLKFQNCGNVHNHNDVRKLCFEKLLYKMLNIKTNVFRNSTQNALLL
jgi:hypothetical protein